MSAPLTRADALQHLYLAARDLKLKPNSAHRELALVKAMQAFCPDPDDALDDLRSTLGIDADGNKLDADGYPVPDAYDGGRWDYAHSRGVRA